MSYDPRRRYQVGRVRSASGEPEPKTDQLADLDAAMSAAIAELTDRADDRRPLAVVGWIPGEPPDLLYLVNR